MNAFSLWPQYIKISGKWPFLCGYFVLDVCFECFQFIASRSIEDFRTSRLGVTSSSKYYYAKQTRKYRVFKTFRKIFFMPLPLVLKEACKSLFSLSIFPRVKTSCQICVQIIQYIIWNKICSNQFSANFCERSMQKIY